MASLYKKVIGGRPYWYLREMGWVNGKPKLVSERYLGTAAEIAALLDAREQAIMPERTRHLGFGDVAAAWGGCRSWAWPASSTRWPVRGAPMLAPAPAPTRRWRR